MVAYSFRERFIKPIQVGLSSVQLSFDPPPKRQTIRAIGKRRHARPSEILQLYYAMRTKQCRSIGVARCTDVKNIRISIETNKVEIEEDIWREIRTRSALNQFARSDGFEDWADMQAFWRKEHRGKRVGPFVGVMIEWEPIR